MNNEEDDKECPGCFDCCSLFDECCQCVCMCHTGWCRECIISEHDEKAYNNYKDICGCDCHKPRR